MGSTEHCRIHVVVLHLLLYGIDGTSVGISLETASPADLAHLDQLLSQLADLKTTAEVTKMAASGRKEDRKVGVAVSNKAEPTCGTTVSGVRCLSVA